MQQGRGGMGSHKHGISGYGGPSPRLKMWQKLEGAKPKPKRKKQKMYGSIGELMGQEVRRNTR